MESHGLSIVGACQVSSCRVLGAPPGFWATWMSNTPSMDYYYYYYYYYYASLKNKHTHAFFKENYVKNTFLHLNNNMIFLLIPSTPMISILNPSTPIYGGGCREILSKTHNKNSNPLSTNYFLNTSRSICMWDKLI
jgi:hypothetical protein